MRESISLFPYIACERILLILPALVAWSRSSLHNILASLPGNRILDERC